MVVNVSGREAPSQSEFFHLRRETDTSHHLFYEFIIYTNTLKAAKMDFAALMSKEISKAKAPGSDKQEKETTSQPEKKYVRRGEQEATRVAAYHEDQERQRRDREERITQKRKLDDEEAERRRERDAKKQKLAEGSRKKRDEEEAVKERERRRKLGLPELPPVPTNEDDEKETTAAEGEGGELEKDMSDEGLSTKLRDLNEPACLFGEDHTTRLRRYHRLHKRALAPKPKLSDGPIPTTLELVPEIQMKVSPVIPKNTETRTFLFRQLASFFNMMLAEWDDALGRRDLEVKMSLAGRQAYNAMVQSRDNMKPLFRKMEKGDVTDEMLGPILEIVDKAQQRKYVDANDAYLRLSIGKA